MSSQYQHPAVAACDRLIATIEASQALESKRQAAGPDAIRVPLIRYALALLRMRIRPALEQGWRDVDPVHVAMFGATNSGKSTVLNVLLGRSAAGMDFKARFSQHPVAFRPEALGNPFLDHYPTRFAGYRRYTDQAPPRQDDAELRDSGYVPALAVNDPTGMGAPILAPPASESAVFWDAPDFSTEEARTYMPAVLDTVALADLVLISVTGESYADDRGLRLASLIVSSGVAVRVVANKLGDGMDPLLDDIIRKLAESDADPPGGIPPAHFHPLPHIKGTDEEGLLRRLVACPESVALRDIVTAETATGVALKQKALAGAVRFLDRRLDEILEPLRVERDAAKEWASIVGRGTDELIERHHRDYLEGERYDDFSQTLVRLMRLLEIPGIGRIIGGISEALKKVSRTMFTALGQAVRPVLGRSKARARKPPEEEVVDAALERWFEDLTNKAQVLAQAGEHPAWATVAREMGSREFARLIGEPFVTSYNAYRERMDSRTEERALVLYEVIARNPRLLNAFRAVKLTFDVGSTAAFVTSGGLDWTDALVGPLVAPVQNLILEIGLARVLEDQKRSLKQEQLRMFREVVDETLVRPVLGLFPGDVKADEIDDAHHDFAAVKAAALAVAGEIER